jgi:hypothetical protein
VSDLELKAAFLVNFAQFVEWPPESGPVVIGIAANTALTAAVATAGRGRVIRGRALEARWLATGDSAEGAHVLFIGDLSPDDASALLGRVYGAARRRHRADLPGRSPHAVPDQPEAS